MEKQSSLNGKTTQKCLRINSHLAVEKVGLSIHCFYLFSIFCSELGGQVSLVLKGQRDVLHPIQSPPAPPSESHMGILKA